MRILEKNANKSVNSYYNNVGTMSCHNYLEFPRGHEGIEISLLSLLVFSTVSMLNFRSI